MNDSTAQSGFTLIEVLVTLVVVAVGLLGLMALQTHALAHTTMASQDTLATVAIDDMMDRMRTNSTPDSASIYAAIRADGVAPAGPDCRQVECRPGAMARHDARQWQATLARQLPEGRGDIRCLALDDQARCRRYRVSVIWASPPRLETAADDTIPAQCRHADLSASGSWTMRCLSAEVRPL